MGQSPSSKNYTDNPNDWILIQGNADLKNGKVTPRLYTSQVTKKADIGDIILTVRAPVGEVAITDYKAILGRGVASIKGNLFIYFALEKFKTNNKWNMYSSGSTFDSITGKDLNNLALFFPSKMEENKIGKLLNKLDSLLALYERELKLLSQVKKYFLDNLFAEKEYPNLRFKGFTDAWEQRKLGEIGKIIAGGDKDSKKLRKKGKYPVLANNLENNGIIGYYKNNYKIEAPAITVTARGNIGNAIARFTNFTPVVRLLVLKTNLDVKFIEQSINNINFFIESTGVPQLTVPQLASYSIFIPKKFEQHKIGSLFKFIDNIVALYENKQQHLTEIKKTLLNTMFI